MEIDCDGSEDASAKLNGNVLPHRHHSFELEVRDQLSKVMEMVSIQSRNSERIVAVDIKLDQVLLRLNPGSVHGEDSQAIYTTATTEHSVRTHWSQIHHAKSDSSSNGGQHGVIDPNSVEVDSPQYDQLADCFWKDTAVADCEQDEVGSLPCGESEGVSPGRRSMIRRMSTQSQDAVEGLCRSVKSLDHMLGMHRVNAFRLRMWSLLDDPDSGCLARIFYLAMVFIIIASILLTLGQTMDETPIDVKILIMIDTVFDGIFFLEVLLRFFFCPSRWVFFRQGYNIIDLVSAMPMVIRGATGFAVPVTQEQYTALDLVLIIFVPTLRLLKLLRHFKHLRLLRFAAGLAMEALVVPLFLLLIICMGFSGLIYILEPRSNIASLPHAVWLVVVTLSTVGYGDTLPSSAGGYVVMTMLVASGVLYMAIPISIVGQAWNSVWSRRDEILLMDLARERLKVWGYTVSDMQKLFEAFDLNNDALLDIDEFSCMLTEMHIGLSIQRVAELFGTLDSDNSGFVDLPEFSKALFPEQYIDVVRQRSSLVLSGEDTVSSPKSSHSSPKARMLLRSLSSASGLADSPKHTPKALHRSGSGISNDGSSPKTERVKRALAKRHGDTTQHAGSKTKESFPGFYRETDEHPSISSQNGSPPLPFEDRPDTVPKSACQLGFISEASAESREDVQLTTCCALNGHYSLQSTAIGCTEAGLASNSTDSFSGLQQL